jgi:hypothetical protein
VGSLYAHDAAIETGAMFGLFVALALIEITTGARARARCCVCTLIRPHRALTARGRPVNAGIPKVFQLLNDPDAAPAGDYKFDPLGFSTPGNIRE